MHLTMGLLSSEFHKVSPRHVVSFMFAVLISIHGSSSLWSCGSFRKSEGTIDEYDDTDFFLDIYINLCGFYGTGKLRFYIRWDVS